MKTKKMLFICFILIIAGTFSVSALDVKGKAPTFKGYNTIAVDAINEKLKDFFDEAINELKDDVGDIKSKPEDLIKSFGNSSIFASHGATQRAYGGYDLFAVTFGAMVGLQLPSSPFNIMDDMEDMTDNLNDEGDIKMGLNPQILNARIGINTSKFLVEGLYLGLHFGTMKLNMDSMVEGFEFNSFSLGATANYQLFSHKKIAGGLLLWRGLNLGSGFIYQKTNLSIPYSLGSITQDESGLSLVIDPEILFDIQIKTVTIPLEAVTSVRLLYFLNLSLGAGVDLGFGKSKMDLSMFGDVAVKGAQTQQPGVEPDKKGNISVNAGGDMSPRFFNPKLITGVGFSLGPVIIDIPITFYLGNGYNMGVTLGVVW